METVPVSSSSPNAEADPTENTPAKKRRRRLYSSEAGWRKIRVPANCSPAIDHLKKELGVRSGGDAILWLIDQVRPELITHGPNPKRNQPCGPNISPVPACMPQQGEEHLQLSFPGGSPATRRPPVRATVVQASTLFFDTAATLDKAERLTAMAAAYGSQLLVFPEAFIGGYPRCVRLEAAALPQKTEAEGEFQKYYDSAINVPGPEVERLAKIAGKYRIHLVMGVVERAELYLFSTVLFFDPQGQHLGQHRKLMLVPPENAVWSSGKKSSVPIFETSIGRIGGLICWDNKLPHLRTELYTKGVEIYCAPTADAREVWKATVTHTALEGGCFVLSANQFCRRRDYPLQNGDSEEDASLDAITSDGGSLIVSPSGTILAGPNYKGECLISADLDLGEITRTKTEFGGVVE